MKLVERGTEFDISQNTRLSLQSKVSTPEGGCCVYCKIEGQLLDIGLHAVCQINSLYSEHLLKVEIIGRRRGTWVTKQSVKQQIWSCDITPYLVVLPVTGLEGAQNIARLRRLSTLLLPRGVWFGNTEIIYVLGLLHKLAVMGIEIND